MKLSIPMLLGTVTAGMFGSAALAHHSFAMFDSAKSMEIDGTLKSVQLTNPHSYFVLTAAGPDGALKDWLIEGPSPNNLIRRGWKQTDVHAGDRVTITFHPRKDGGAGGIIMSMHLPDGRTLQSGASSRTPPPAPAERTGDGPAPAGNPPQ
ncbi:MAG: DUF6152 family protein [Pseudomonadota bacterium]|nr:DUF6152 family protein [Pseudomonadota bacterium]